MDNLRILIVDDDIVNTKILKKKIEKKNFLCDVLTDASKILEFIENNKPDAILLDILMPGVNGIEALENIRNVYTKAELPILMLTSKEETSEVIKALGHGANDYITKPANISVLIARLRMQLDLVRLTKESLAKKQFETINALIVTYNHEINNPLTIAMGFLKMGMEKQDPEYFKKSLAAMDRVSEIVKKVDQLTNTSVEEIDYTNRSKMFKLG